MKKEIKDKDYNYRYCCLKNNLGITSERKLKQAESDFAVVRISEILKEDYFEPTVEYFKSLHKYIFGDVYPFAGTFRNIQIYREERILARLSVNYAQPKDIESNLTSIFDRIRNTDFYSLNTEEKIEYISNVIVDIWQTHAYREGNTRTVLIFLRQMINSYGLTINSDLFTNTTTFAYIRDAFVAASFEAKDLGIEKNKQYINRVISDIINNNLKKKRGI